jgi:glycosyltransferase involved in cell wall biosynthesis
VTGGEKHFGPVLFIGNFLSGHDGRRTYSEDLSARLEAAGVAVLRASSWYPKAARMADMAGAALGARGPYRVAVVDVYSGQAFLWAEAAARAAKMRGRAVVLALHGGRLPEFAERRRGRVARLLRLADAVVAPSGYLRDALGGLRGDIEVIPNAIDLRQYPFRLRMRAEARLAWLRSFHEIYNPEMAVEVLGRVRAERPEARLTMYGADKDGSLGRGAGSGAAAGRGGGGGAAERDPERRGGRGAGEGGRVREHDEHRQHAGERAGSDGVRAVRGEHGRGGRAVPGERRRGGSSDEARGCRWNGEGGIADFE